MMPRRPSKDELKGIVQKMIDANESEENIATVIKKAQESPDVFERLTSPLVPQIADAAHAIADHIDAPKLDRSEGEARVYGFIAGATGAAGDLVAGFTSPIGIAMTLAGLSPESRVAEAVPALKSLLKIPAVKTLQSAVQGGSSAGFAAKGAYDAATAPTTEGKLLGAAQAASGAAGFGLGAPEATLGSTRAVGRAFVEAGNHPGAIRMGVGGFMGGAAAAGHLDAAATALPALLVPQVLKKTGQGIIRLGTPVIDRPPVSSPMLDRFRPNVSSASDATPIVADRVPIMGDVPSEATGQPTVDPRIAQLMARNRGMTTETAQRALTLSDQAAVGGSVRPPIQPVGQAATDLANGPVAKARPLYNQQAAAENIANGSSYNNGHVLQDPKPTELSDLATEGPDTGMVYDAEHGVAVPRDLSFEAGHPDVPGLTVGKAGTNPLSNRPAPKGSIRVGKGPLDDILGPEGPKGAFDWPEAGGRFEPDATGSHVRKAPSTPAYSPVRSQQEFLDRTKALYESAGKKFTDNAAVTAANAYSSGARVPEDVLQDFFQKTKNRQADHIADHYLQNRQIPE